MSSTERLLGDVLSLMGNDEEQLVRLGNYGREVILQYYSVQRMVSDCRKAYAAALPRQNKKHNMLSQGARRGSPIYM